MRTIVYSILLALGLSLVSPVFTTSAQSAAENGFTPNTIITDDQMNDYLSMSAGRIQEFLANQTGTLKDFVAPDGRTAAQVIYDAAQTSQISPKVLLVTIQKESSMITKSVFSTTGYSASQQYYLDWITFYGWCDSCSTGIQKGFVNQITATAAAFRRYLDLIASSGTSISGWGPNVTKTFPCLASDYNNGRQICIPDSDIDITPTNAATSALYTYTPHPGGNYAFWTIWKNFNFNLHRVYPDGTLLRAKGAPDVYILQSGVKRRFTNPTAFLATYSFKQVVQVSLDTLLQYDTGAPIYYANYTLLAAPNRGVYLIANDVKRPIKAASVLVSAGLKGKPVIKVTWDVLNLFPDGAPVTADEKYPAGALIQNKKNGQVFYVKDNVKYPIPSGDIYKSQFGQQKAIQLSGTDMDAFTWGAFIGFKDGELIQSKNGGAVYFISNGYRLPIASTAAAKAYGFDKIMKMLIKTTDKAIAVHPEGQALDVDTGMVSLASQ